MSLARQIRIFDPTDFYIHLEEAPIAIRVNSDITSENILVPMT